MIYSELTVDKWLDKYPGLKGGLPLCECEDPALRGYHTRLSAGIECQVCGSSVWTRDKFEGNLYFVKLLAGRGSVT